MLQITKPYIALKFWKLNFSCIKKANVYKMLRCIFNAIIFNIINMFVKILEVWKGYSSQLTFPCMMRRTVRETLDVSVVAAPTCFSIVVAIMLLLLLLLFIFLLIFCRFSCVSNNTRMKMFSYFFQKFPTGNVEFLRFSNNQSFDFISVKVFWCDRCPFYTFLLCIVMFI